MDSTGKKWENPTALDMDKEVWDNSWNNLRKGLTGIFSLG